MTIFYDAIMYIIHVCGDFLLEKFPELGLICFYSIVARSPLYYEFLKELELMTNHCVWSKLFYMSLLSFVGLQSRVIFPWFQ